MSVSARILLVSAFILAMTAGGVPAGANSAYQLVSLP
jgi:hypothetical protein